MRVISGGEKIDIFRTEPRTNIGVDEIRSFASSGIGNQNKNKQRILSLYVMGKKF